MSVYITKINGWSLKDEAHYMQHMIAEIAHQLGSREMGIYRYNADTESIESRNSRFDGIIAGINKGDIVICQFPTGNGLKFERALVAHIKAYGGRVAIWVHELKALAEEGRFPTLKETVGLYNQAEVLIVDTYAMKRYLLDNGVRNEMKFVVQEMWDYMTGNRYFPTPAFKKEIYFTERGGFAGINDWNYAVPLKLYNVSASQGQNRQNMGEREPYQLFSELSVGGFGLVWYRDERFHRYMKYSASFSLARYLAAGLPVIVPVGISSRSIIEENHLGLAVNSLEEAAEAVEAMTESDYREYTQCVAQFAPALRNGYYTKKCLIDAMQVFYRRDAGRILIPEEIYRLEDCAFTSTELHESYDGNLALSWIFRGKTDGFLICDSTGKTVLIDIKNTYQHYILLKGGISEDGVVIMAYLDTLRGRLIIAESNRIYLRKKQYGEPRVSLIMPAYNAENHIVRTVDTVLAQDFPDLEIVIVDDGSTDGTRDILDWYADKYANMKVIHQENSGASAARNAGIMQAAGEYIGFVDSDDMIYPDMTARLYHSAKKNNCDIAVTSAYYITNTGRDIPTFLQYPMEEDVPVDIEKFVDILFISAYQYPVIWNKIYRTSLVKEHLFPLIKYEDEAWLPYILSFADRVCYLAGGLYEYDRSTNSNTLSEQLARNSNDVIFEDRKRAILFYLENGNPGRLEKLKELARKELALFAMVYKNAAYENLWKQIEKSYGKRD